MSEIKTYALLMMGGIGSRFQNLVPKQFSIVRGKPIFLHLLKAYDSFDLVDGIIIVCNEEWIDYAKDFLNKEKLIKLLKIVPGGSTRSQSVKNGLSALNAFAHNKDIILIHDATHPFLDKKATAILIDEIRKNKAGSLGNFVYDTAYLKTGENYIKDNINRNDIVVGASPEGYVYEVMSDIYFKSSDEYLNNMTSAGALAKDFKINMKFVETKFPSIKITYPEDLEIFISMFDFFFKE